MAILPEVVFPEDELYRSVIYTGNSAEINALIADFTIANETATELSFTSGGTPYVVAHDGYIVYQNGVVTHTFLNVDDYRDNFGSVVPAAAHHHQVILTSGPAIHAVE